MSFLKRIFREINEPLKHQKFPSRGVLRKKCSENMQQIYRRTHLPKRDFNATLFEITIRTNKDRSNKLNPYDRETHKMQIRQSIQEWTK